MRVLLKAKKGSARFDFIFKAKGSNVINFIFLVFNILIKCKKRIIQLL